jgi:hypothetical protein
VYFPQVHTPGRLSQSDFTHMGSLGITIGGELFDHLSLLQKFRLEMASSA